jgi:hypothetical protein
MKTMFAVAAVLLAACGGGSDEVDAQLTRIDSRPVVDAPIIPATCTLETNITEAPNPDPTTGNTAVLRTQNTATPPEEIILWNFAVAGTGTNPDLFQFVVPFTADPNSIPPADFNTPLELVLACTADVDYCMVGLGDIDQAGMEAQFFYPNTGQLTITEAGDIGGTFTVTMTDSRFDWYTDPAGMIVDENMDDVPDCSGTMAAFADISIPITAPAVAPEPGTQHLGKFGKYTRTRR